MAPKTRAEIQKAYRERKTSADKASYLQKEREHKHRSYIPLSQLEGKELTKAQGQNREKQRNFLKQKREVDSTKDDPLIVKMDFSAKRKRKRVSREVARVHKKIKVLEESNDRIQRKAWRLEKKLTQVHGSATKKKRSPCRSLTEENPQAPLTPKRSTNRLLKSVGLSPKKVPRSVKKDLIMKEAVIQEISSTLSSDPPSYGISLFKKTTKKRLISSMVPGKILKKYRCISNMKRKANISRKMLSSTKGKLTYPVKRRLSKKKKVVTDLVAPDTPTSQYRNKTMFYIVANHLDLFGASACWNFFEAGHGKGPCDGVGGSVKRMADEAVKQQKVVLQDANDFFAWTKTLKESTKITYKFVSQSKCDEAKDEISSFGAIRVLPGTMRLHAVVGMSRDRVLLRETSCYCHSCFHRGEFEPKLNCLWKKHQLQKLDTRAVTSESITLCPNDWVAAVYDKKWYIGKILEILKDQDALISFMEHSKTPSTFKAPLKVDELWVDFQSVLAVIDEPRPQGKTKRLFQVNEESVEAIEVLMETWLQDN